MEKKNIEDFLEVPKDYHIVSEPKAYITSEIKSRMKEKKISFRKLGDKIGLKHPQIVRATSGTSYNIDTLLRILDGLDLELVIKKKEQGTKDE